MRRNVCGDCVFFHDGCDEYCPECRMRLEIFNKNMDDYDYSIFVEVKKDAPVCEYYATIEDAKRAIVFYKQAFYGNSQK